MSRYQGSAAHRQNALNAQKMAVQAKTKARKERVRKYYQNPLVCLAKDCTIPIPYESRRTNKYCSKSCSVRTSNRNRKHTTETKEKISQALLAPLVESGRVEIVGDQVFYNNICVFCGHSFASRTRLRKTCSKICLESEKIKNIDPEEKREWGRRAVERQMKAGRWKGWDGRGTPSFPEKWVEKELKKRGIQEFEREKRVNRFSLDFAFSELMLALEVDGKQHQYPEQRAHDIKRDAFLKSKGWTVVRMPWVSVKTEQGKQDMMEAVDRFVEIWRIHAIDFLSGKV